ncbi:type IV pilus assembly protein PilA [Krasilnikovia cinnamomea]|uniref:Type IV pilus assembly protein PilA n=1 Tax=Krasilnikovia cinnamomea TaxID=349313 RepID=A0A4Q7ZPA7_9ACTN|nr:prepilin-type N-terminal cleavage/methylation domain-containing protein [Krasilnikovia cinnamomea]RZU52245.1 type IV pilus assembly protein PilA [Krasilnikovia cinnamomea]
MRDIMKRMRAAKGDEGFTLIELLVVVVIIGVLVAIAVPVYLNYRKGAADKAAQSDVRGAVSAIEQFYTDNSNNYPDTKSEDNSDGTKGTLEVSLATGGTTTGKITLSDGTKLGYVKGTGPDAGTYTVCATNNGGSKWYVYKSKDGGSVKAVSGTIASLATCA